MRLFIPFTIVFMLSGCATHAPMSEMLMFQQKEDYDGKIYQSRYSHSILSLTINLYSPEAVNIYAEKRDPTGNDTQYDYRYATSLMTNAIFMSDQTKNFAVSLGFGNDIGIDATIKLFNKTYLSSAIDVLNDQQGQIIIQRRILDGTPTGLSLGVTYQRNYQYVAIDGVSCGFCFPSEEFFTNSVGFRTVGIVAPPSRYGKSSFFLYVTGSVNYDLTIETVYPKIGFSLGFY